MRVTADTLGLCLIAALGCAQPRLVPLESHSATHKPIAWRDDWSPLLGQRITLDGWAVEQKLGPALYEDAKWDKRSISMDIDGWPNGYFEGGKSKHVRVTGTVIKRADVPVFLAEPGTNRPKGDRSGNIIGISGIPVYSQEELDSRKWRFLLADVKWEIID